MMMRAVFLAANILALAACADEAVDVPAEPASVETPMPVEPDGGIGDGAGPPDATQEALANRIPTRFHGVWDFVDGTCARESDLRLEISGSEIMFYESFGKVLNVEEDGNSIAVALAMEGEGDTWQETLGFAISEDGEQLTQFSVFDIEFEPPPPVKMPPPLLRKRCPK